MGEQKGIRPGSDRRFLSRESRASLAIGSSPITLMRVHFDVPLWIAQGIICLGIAVFLYRARRPRESSVPVV